MGATNNYLAPIGKVKDMWTGTGLEMILESLRKLATSVATLQSQASARGREKTAGLVRQETLSRGTLQIPSSNITVGFDLEGLARGQ